MQCIRGIQYENDNFIRFRLFKICGVFSSEANATKTQLPQGETELKKPEVVTTSSKELTKTVSQAAVAESSEYETETDEEGLKLFNFN